MSSAAAVSRPNRAFRFFDATIVKKAIVALTGLVMFGFVAGHLAGNLQMFAGDHGEAINKYSLFLKSLGEILWVVRLGLLAALVLHVVFTIQLWRVKNAARPIQYVKKDNSHSSLASKTMYLTGPTIFFFIGYHLLHFTLGKVQPGQFVEGNVYATVINGFQQPIISAFYIISMGLLCLHLNHGLSSIWQTLGLYHPRYTPLIKKGAAAISIVIFVGFVSIPLGVLTNVITL